LVPHLSDLSYNERLFNLNLPVQEKKRTRGDMIQMYIIYKEFNNVDLHTKNAHFNKNYAKNLRPASTVTTRRRANIRLEKEFVKNCTVCETSFTNRVADQWNKLSEETIEARSVNGFKARYYRFIYELTEAQQ
jgi:hypothetical protein